MKIQNLKLKAVFLSQDGGKTWICARQHYLSDLRSDRFLNATYQGATFTTLEDAMEKSNDGQGNPHQDMP
jgi:hypothetical protein